MWALAEKLVGDTTTGVNLRLEGVVEQRTRARFSRADLSRVQTKSPAHVRTIEIGVLQIRIGQDGAQKLRRVKVGAAQNGVNEDGASELGKGQPGARKFCRP